MCSFFPHTHRNTNTMNHSCFHRWNERLSFVPEIWQEQLYLQSRVTPPAPTTGPALQSSNLLSLSLPHFQIQPFSQTMFKLETYRRLGEVRSNAPHNSRKSEETCQKPAKTCSMTERKKVREEVNSWNPAASGLSVKKQMLKLQHCPDKPEETQTSWVYSNIDHHSNISSSLSFSDLSDARCEFPSCYSSFFYFCCPTDENQKSLLSGNETNKAGAAAEPRAALQLLILINVGQHEVYTFTVTLC